MGRLRDQLQLAHEALGDPSADDADRGGYGTYTLGHVLTTPTAVGSGRGPISCQAAVQV